MEKTPRPRLEDFVEAADRLRKALRGVSLETFQLDWRRRWLVERGLEIISEPSRHLPDDLKARHPDIPWRKVAGIGNVLRHDYERVSAPVIWKLVLDDLPAIEEACQAELRRGA